MRTEVVVVLAVFVSMPSHADQARKRGAAAQNPLVDDGIELN